MTNLWEITNPVDTPVMYCAASPGLGIETSIGLIRDLLKRAKKDRVWIDVITISIIEEGTGATLYGTRDMR